ncbi:MAG: zinc ribbon domain-containing protein [Desulfotomaculaceae bacterium]|nr:zinc ribbon domain-containing protein [Desulfotomaculaceae bacterium]
MPIYEFRCAECGHRFEKLCQAGDNGENLHCPNCNNASPKRVMSTFSALGGRKNGSGSGCASCISSNCTNCGQ